MGLVNDEVPPAELLQSCLLDDCHFIGRDDDFELARFKELRALQCASFLVAMELHDINRGAPSPELVVPVGEGGLRSNHQVLSTDAAEMLEITEQ